MSKAPDLREIPELPDEIVQAGLNGELVLFIGAGASKLLGLPSWGDLAWQSLQSLQKNGLLDFSDLEHLKYLEPKKQLSIATLIATENKKPLDLVSCFQGKSEGSSIYKAINDIGCVCVTTNYDELLAPRYLETKDGSVTPAPVRRICHREDLLARHLDEPGTVIHLHGVISFPENMVVTTKNYLEHYDNANVQHFLGELFSKKTVLFIGYGLEETEILEHILRRGSSGRTADRRKFVLQGYFRSELPLYLRLHQYYEMSFGVHLVGFVRDYRNYSQQEAILKDWGPRIQVNKPTLDADMFRMNEVLNHE